jgi:hypothetical protein
MVSLNGWTFGGGFTRENVSNLLPTVTFTNFMVSTRLSIFEFEYTVMQNFGGVNLSPIHVLSTTVGFRKLTLTAAVRRLNYIDYGEVTQSHFAIQYLFSKHFSLGFLVNYIPGTESIGTQFYL